MNNWQQRVVDEKEMLDEKLQKLHAFLTNIDNLNSPVDELQRYLLLAQFNAMQTYSAVLAIRIKHFN